VNAACPPDYEIMTVAPLPPFPLFEQLPLFKPHKEKRRRDVPSPPVTICETAI